MKSVFHQGAGSYKLFCYLFRGFDGYLKELRQCLVRSQASTTVFSVWQKCQLCTMNTSLCGLVVGLILHLVAHRWSKMPK